MLYEVITGKNPGLATPAGQPPWRHNPDGYPPYPRRQPVLPIGATPIIFFEFNQNLAGTGSLIVLNSPLNFEPASLLAPPSCLLMVDDFEIHSGRVSDCLTS